MRRDAGKDKGIANVLGHLLRDARKAPVAEHSTAIASRIAAGHLTRERSCDGKTRFKTYDFAANVGRENGVKYKKEFRVYACPFCRGFHLASVAELPA